MNTEHAPVDAIRMRAEQIVSAALAWRASRGSDPILDKNEWALYVACEAYGERFAGVVSR